MMKIRPIENILIYTIGILILIYPINGFSFEIYLILLFGIIIFLNRYINFNRITKGITRDKYYILPQKARNELGGFSQFLWSIGLIAFFIIYYLLMNHFDLIKTNKVTGIAKYVLPTFVLIYLFFYVIFSDLSNKYFIDNYGIIEGYRFNYLLKWTSVTKFELDKANAEIKLYDDKKILKKLKIKAKYFSDNIDEIEIKIKKYMA